MRILLTTLTTEIRSWMHWGLSQTIMMLLMYMSWGKLWKGWKIITLLAMMEFDLKSISLYLTVCRPWCQYFFPVVCLLVSYRVPLCMEWSHCYWNENLKIQEMLTTIQANSNCHSSLQGTWADLAVATRQVPVDCRQPIWFKKIFI